MNHNPVVISTWKHGLEANRYASKLIYKNKKALDVVEQGVRVTESDINIRTVGYGGYTDNIGNVTLDAAIMDHNNNAGSVAYLKNIKHPISVARKVMEKSEHVMLVGSGAYNFAIEHGFKDENILVLDKLYGIDVKGGSKLTNSLDDYLKDMEVVDKAILFGIAPRPFVKKDMGELLCSGKGWENNLNHNDLFNIIAYNDTYFSMSQTSLPVNELTILNAYNFIDNLNANGGTRALDPLKHAMLMSPIEDKIKMILFITDGDIGYERNVFNIVDSYLGKSRLFSIGIGTAPNGHLLEKVSQKGRGTYTYINNINHVDEKMKELLNKIDMPVLTDIRLDLNNQAELYPSPLPDLFINEPLIVFGKINSDISGDINSFFSGKTSSGYFKVEIPINISKGVKNDGIGDIWARKKMDNLIGVFTRKIAPYRYGLPHNLVCVNLEVRVCS